MRKNLLFLPVLLALGFSTQVSRAQIIDPKKDAEIDATNRANNNISSTIDNGLGKTEGAIKGLFKKKKKPADATTQQPVATPAAAPTTPAAPAGFGGPGFSAYNNYDFVPGDKILFEDHFTDDDNGEFPSHWNLAAGQGVINMVGNDKAFMLTSGNYARVSPLMKNPSYLTDPFTIEFDEYGNDAFLPKVYFYPKPNYDGDDNFGVQVSKGSVGYFTGGTTVLDANLPADIGDENFNKRWHHVAIAYKKGQMKIYVDQYRVLVVPHVALVPVQFELAAIGDASVPTTIKDFRIASGGGMNMLGKKFTDAKIVTHGINFDIDKATIKPESMGTLNMIVSVMKDNPEVNFEVDGHTDNSGTSPHNMQLSQARADAVKAQLVTMGVDASRLTTKGYGDSKPISDNVTIEGKANNRRVEFVKI